MKNNKLKDKFKLILATFFLIAFIYFVIWEPQWFSGPLTKGINFIPAIVCGVIFISQITTSKEFHALIEKN